MYRFSESSSINFDKFIYLWNSHTYEDKEYVTPEFLLWKTTESVPTMPPTPHPYLCSPVRILFVSFGC